jgi:hypothetical protein
MGTDGALRLMSPQFVTQTHTHSDTEAPVLQLQDAAGWFIFSVICAFNCWPGIHVQSESAPSETQLQKHRTHTRGGGVISLLFNYTAVIFSFHSRSAGFFSLCDAGFF